MTQAIEFLPHTEFLVWPLWGVNQHMGVLPLFLTSPIFLSLSNK